MNHTTADATATATAPEGPVDLEGHRVAVLHGYRVLDTPTDPELDAVVRLAAAVTGVTTATVNLIDTSRQCQLGATGFAGTTSPRSESMCARNLGHPDVVVVPDARRDPRYADTAWVDGRTGQVRFYASAPLLTPDGTALGSLCVFDTQVRDLTPDQVDRLADLASLVMALLERHRRSREQEQLVAEVEEQRELLQITLAHLQAREEFTAALLDTVDVGVVAADGTGHLTVLNRAARRFHGLDLDPGLDPADHATTYALFAADGTTPLQRREVPLHRTLAEGSLDGIEMVIAPTGAQPRLVQCSGRRLTDEDGTVLGAVVAMHDITADRAHRAALEEAGEALRRSNAELADLAAVASHDLASPLTAVTGYLDLLGDVHGHLLPPDGREWLATAVRAAHRMQLLIEAVLGHARAGSSALAVEPVPLREVLTAVVEDLGASVADAHVSVAGSAHVVADPTLLRQLLQNLVGNSSRYRAPDRTCQVQVRVADSPFGGWELAVVDNGRGIPAAMRQEVFRMFTVADAGAGVPAGGPRRPGHGIGLATCQRIVERHGGSITVSETRGGGATVRCWFPPVDLEPATA